MTDERYQKIMADLGMPNSRSLLQALQQVANEAAQETQAAERERCARLCEQMGAATWWPNEARDMADLLRKMILEGPNAEVTGNARR